MTETGAKGTTFAEDVLDAYFFNEDITLIGDAAGLQNSAVAGNVYLSLHSADPGVGGDQTTNELSYTGYVRVAMPRDTSTWKRANQTINNLIAFNWPQNTGTTQTATHVGVGDSAHPTAGKLRYMFPLSKAWTIINGMTPSMVIDEIAFTEV